MYVEKVPRKKTKKMWMLPIQATVEGGEESSTS
jgi:hypothetical protein